MQKPCKIQTQPNTERYRSGHNGADSKSVCAHAHEGSNPSLSATLSPKSTILGSFSFVFCPIFDLHSPLLRKTPFVVFMPSISFLQGYARQLQGCSKTPYFQGRIDMGRYANKLSRYQLVCNYSREFELNKENRPLRLLEAVLIYLWFNPTPYSSRRRCLPW